MHEKNKGKTSLLLFPQSVSSDATDHVKRERWMLASEKGQLRKEAHSKVTILLD